MKNKGKLSLKLILVLLISLVSDLTRAQNCSVSSVTNTDGIVVAGLANQATQSFRATVNGKISDFAFMVQRTTSIGYPSTVKVDITDSLDNILYTTSLNAGYSSTASYKAFTIPEAEAPFLVRGQLYKFKLTKTDGQNLSFIYNQNGYADGQMNPGSQDPYVLDKDLFFDIKSLISASSLTNTLIDDCTDFPKLVLVDSLPDDISTYDLYKDNVLFLSNVTDTVVIKATGSYHFVKKFDNTCSIMSNAVDIQHVPAFEEIKAFTYDSTLIDGNYYQIGDTVSFSNRDANGCLLSLTLYRVQSYKTTPLQSDCNLFLKLKNNYVPMGTGPALSSSPFSISVWVKRNRLNTEEIFFRYGSVSSAEKAIHVGWRQSNRLLMGFYGDDLEVDGPVDLYWHHYAFVYDNTAKQKRIYIDGVLAGQATSNDFTGDRQYFLGGMRTDFMLFDGYLEDLQLWNRTLTAAEIDSVVRVGTSTVSDGKLIHFDFNEDVYANELTNRIDGNTVFLYSPDLELALTDSLGNPQGDRKYVTDYFNTVGDSVTVAGVTYYADTVLTDTLVSAYGCDSVITSNLTFTDVRIPANDSCNTALRLDGSNGIWAGTTFNISNSSFTFSTWAKRERTNIQELYFTLGSVDQARNELHFGFRDNGNIVFGFWSADTEVADTPDTDWHLYSFSFDANTNTRKVYKDGLLIRQETGASFIGNSQMLIGGLNNRGRYFKGLLEDMQLWNTALTDAEIVQLYQSNKEVRTGQRLFYFDFNEIRGEQALTNRVNNTVFLFDEFDSNQIFTNFEGTPSGRIKTYQTVSSCSSYTLNDSTYTSSGTFEIVKTTTTGCDSIIVLQLTINQPNVVNVAEFICGSYDFNGTPISTSGLYTDTLTNIYGCDSVVNLNLTIVPNSSSTDIQTACGSFTWIDGNTYTESTNTATFTLRNSMGCDSVITLDLTVGQYADSVLTVTQCDSFEFKGQTLTSSGIYYDTLASPIDCGTIITLNLTLTESTSSQLTVSQCTEYDFNGVILTTSGVYLDTLTNAAGCDSVITLNLTINQPTASTDTQIACGSFTWIDGNTYTESTNTPTFTLTNALGCDSVVTLNLTINQPGTRIDEQVACGNFTWIDGNTYMESTNTPTFTFTNALGCDSVITLNLTINQPSTGIDEQVACGSFTWIDGQTYIQSTNTPTHTLTNAAGCDSVVTLHLTVNEVSSVTDVHEACDSYTWIDGNTYTESTNTPTVTLTNSVGCDSVITLDLTIHKTPTATIRGGGTIQPFYGAPVFIDFTGTPPFTVEFNTGWKFIEIYRNPESMSVSPDSTIEFTLVKVSTPTCGEGTVSGSALVIVDNVPCPQQLQVPVSVERIYRAAEYLSSDLNALDQTTYTAGKAITLEPGFQVGGDELFTAKIEGCN